MRSVVRDAAAGATAATLVVAYAVSYSALFFHDGAATPGAAMALWSIMLGAAVGGAWSAWRTSIPPLGNGLDSAQAAMLAALSAGASDLALRHGATPAAAAAHVLLGFSLAGLVYGALSFTLGALRLAGHLRLVPYGVVAGFLVATGLALVLGGLKLVLGGPPTPAGVAQFATSDWLRLAAALLFAAAVLTLRRVVRSPFGLPALTFASAAAIDAYFALGRPMASGWFLTASQPLAWTPAAEIWKGGIDWRMLTGLAPQAFAIACIGMISNVSKLVALENMRQADADLDREFRALGLGAFVTALAGGLPASPVIAPTQILADVGGPSRWSGVFCAGVVGAALVFRVDLPGAIPLPVLGGLIMAMGASQFWRPAATVLRQANPVETIFVASVAAVCLLQGFASGVLVGFVGACLIFAFNYGRIGIIRRSATRATVSSNVEYAPDLELFLAQAGGAIHIYWLTGYVFFGSADSVFKTVRDACQAPAASAPESKAAPAPKGKAAPASKGAAAVAPEYVVLDFRGVPGVDASAMQCFDKLRRSLGAGGTALVYCGLDAPLERQFQRYGLIGAGDAAKDFASRDEALEWCEGRLLEAAFGPAAAREEPEDAFLRGLARQIGGIEPGAIARYLARHSLEQPGVIYEQGAPADEMNFVVSGGVTVARRDLAGQLRPLRKMRRNTMVGEMGFFRQGVRSATVLVERPAVLYTLTRESFARMRAEDPALAAALAIHIVKTLSDRLEFANRQTSSLT